MRVPAKFLVTPLFFSCLWFVGVVPVWAAEPVKVEVDSAQWVIKDQKAKTEEFLGRKSLYLTSGFAVLKDVDLEDGVIEVDIAAQNPRSFIGISFRGQSEDDFETVYFRPHKSGLEDAVQYAPSFNGSTAWQLFSGKGFTAAAEIPQGKWIHVRLEITGLSGKVYFNNSEKPVLEIEDLKHGYSHGTLGIWGSANGGYFSNFTYRMDPVANRPERKPAPPAPGILTRWELSEAFDVAMRDLETPLSPTDLKAMKWQAVETEAPGMVVIDRYRRSPDVVRFFATPAERTGKREGRKLVLARTIIESDRDQIKKMSIGYSDEVTVFLNSEPIFIGKSAFRFRDPGFLGIMDVEDDAVYLHLRKGRNELVLAVADYFGGWGFICRMDESLRK